jgi:diacylglycerol kinase
MIMEALNGLYITLSEKSIKLELACAFFALMAVALGYFDIIPTLICISLVLSLELMNTAIETLCDYINPSMNDEIKMIKDISAGSVLLAAMFSFLVAIFMVIT